MALTWPIEREGSPSPTIDTEEPIRTVQHLLGVQGQINARDASGEPSHLLQVDGIFGPKTDAKVRSFQEASGRFDLEPPLAVDGIVGPLTWNALVNALEIVG